MARRLKVVYLSPPPQQKVPWQQDLVAAVEGSHDLVFWDPLASVSDQLKDADVVVDHGGYPRTREMADAAKSLRLWQLMSVGYESFDLDYWRAKGIPVANCSGETSASALAECALMLMLMLGHRWKETQSNIAQRVLYLPMGSELEGKSLGMVGFGASGRALARLARAARMRLSCIDIVAPSAQDQHEFGLEFAGTSQDVDSLIAGSDYVSLHVPLTNETRRLMDARRLRLMKPGAMLINVARGALVDTDALYDVLLEGRIGGAGLDVVDSEPIDPNHPLLQLPNFIVLPHVAGNTYSTSLRRAAFAAQNINLVAEGQSPRSRIDLPASAETQVGLAAAEA